METRYYVMSVQYNKVVQAENRSVPKGYNTYNEAVREFHNVLASDMKNATLGWSFACIISSDAVMLKAEKWVAEEETPVEE